MEVRKERTGRVPNRLGFNPGKLTIHNGTGIQEAMKGCNNASIGVRR